MRVLFCVLMILTVCVAFAADPLPSANEKVSVVLPDFGAELRAFAGPEAKPVPWWPYLVNAGWGGGRGAPSRNGGWLDKNWELIDYIDRSGDYTTHGYLTHRGIWYEVYGSNEYQETIHFHEEGARKFFWDNGIARDMNGERVLSADYNMKVKWWAEKVGWEAFIVCNNAPRWSAVIDYDWLPSPLLGFAMSQDNIGGPTSRIGAGGHGRYCDFCSLKFMHYLSTTNRLPEFRQKYKHIRDYVQANLMETLRQLPPYTKHRWDEAEAALLAKLCEPPVMSEYQKFLYLSHLHDFLRYYKEAKLLAGRVGRDYDVHGNQGGGAIGPNPYQVALADFVDSIWFESAGISAYDMFKYHWNNADGPFRFEICRAMSRGRRPTFCMTGFQKHSPDMVEHEMAEECAGGGVLFVNQETFEKEPELEQLMTQYFRFRHAHRALFAEEGRERHAQIAMAYSIPSMMYHDYQYSAYAPPVRAMAGMARALEEGHLSYDVVILNHPEIHADHIALDDLKRYRLVILPALECLTDSQIQLFTQYLQGGGVLGVIGESGLRNEDNLPRERPPIEDWRKAGKVADILPHRNFLACRTIENDETRDIARVAIESTRSALGGTTILSGDLPRLLWVKAWRHWSDFISLHFVNYDVDFESGKAKPTAPAKVTVAMPAGIPAEEAAWLTPDGTRQAVEMAADGGKVTVTIPAVRVYGILVVGKKGLDAKRSAILHGNALLARAKMASGGTWGDRADRAAAFQMAVEGCSSPDCTTEQAVGFAQETKSLLHATQKAEDEEYLQGIRKAAVMDDATFLFDFGAKEAKPPWKIVACDSLYSPQAGFGWLPPTDASTPTPEETYYAGAQRYGGKIASDVMPGHAIMWPYKEPLPAPLATNLACGSPRQFRADVPPGPYTVRVVTSNPSWTHRNFLLSGMVAANGAVYLADAPHDKGDVVSREFSVSAPEGKLELTFGGPTGWAVAAVMIRPGASPEDTQMTQGLRAWQVSPRYSNPDWYPITQVAAPPEKRLASLPDPTWMAKQAPPAGLPVIDLGANRDAEIGDVAYAVTLIPAPAASSAMLHFGATSQAQLWLNGAEIGYVPNEKGLRRDEFVAPIRLQAGENRLVVKLQRFWERRWMFYASVTDRKEGQQR